MTKEEAINQAVLYLNARHEALMAEWGELERRYDTMPRHGWDRIDEIRSEASRIARIVEGLRS